MQHTFSLLKVFLSLASSPSPWLLNLNFEFKYFIYIFQSYFLSESFVSVSSRYHPNNFRLHLPSLTLIAWPPSVTMCNEMVISVQFSRSVVSDSLQSHGLQYTRPPWSLPKLMSIESVMTSNHLILCRPLLFLPSIFPRIRIFSKESAHHIKWPKYWSFSYNILPTSFQFIVLPMNIQDRFLSGWAGCISLQSKELSRVVSNTTVEKHQFFGAQLRL